MDFTQIHFGKICKINIGGKNYENISGNMTITDDGVFLNGQPIDEYKEPPIVKIEITGDVEKVESEACDVTVNGNVGSIDSKNGNIHCGNVMKNVESKNGNIHCGEVSGDVISKNGNIYRQ